MQQLSGRSRRWAAMTVDPRSGASFAELRRSELAVAKLRPTPIVVAVTGLGPPAMTAASTALLAQAFTALVPGRVAVLDADGVGQSMRDALGAGLSGDVRQLARTLRPGSPRRAVDTWLDFDGAVPLCAGAAAGPRAAIETVDLAAALGQLTRRFTAVLVHVPVESPPERMRWVLSAIDQAVFACDQVDLAAASDWRRDVGPETVHCLVTTGFDSPPGGTVRIGDLDLRATTAIADVLTRVTIGWRS